MYNNKSFYHQTLNLISYIERFTQKKVTKIVTDWILDIQTNKYFLIDLKELRRIDAPRKMRVKTTLNELLATVTCPMCQQNYHPAEMSKSLTSKLIIDFYQNLKNRGAELSFKVNCNWKKKSDVNQVCNLCYDLVVRESLLKETAQRMAIACNYYKKHEFHNGNKSKKRQ